MQKINFQNLPNTTTPVNATNLNAIQTNVENVFNGTVSAGDMSMTTITTTGNATIGGKVNYGSTGREDYGAGGFIYDQTGNMKHKRNTTTDRWSIRDASDNRKFTVYPETGEIEIAGNLNTNGIITRTISGSLGDSAIVWRIMKLPKQFNGTIYITSPNYDGLMQNNIIQVSNAFGKVSASVLSKTTYSSQLFNNLRIIYKDGQEAYLELSTNRGVGSVTLYITIVCSQNVGTLEFLNTVGSVPSGWSSTTASLQQ